MKNLNLKWTKSYCGVSHLGELDKNNVRVTVIQWGDGKRAELRRYPRNYAPSIVTDHKSVNAAKRAGMEWMKKNYIQD
jgi:hypothetical protein